MGLPSWLYGLGLGVLSVGIILYGRYAAVEIATKILAGILFVSTVGVYVFNPAPLSEMGHFFTFEIPGGSWLIIAAFLGLLPTGIDVSLQASEWGKAKRVGMGRIREQLEREGYARPFDAFSSTADDLRVEISKLPAHAQEYCRRWFRIGIWDFTLGHVVSFILATIFLLLAAVTLYPDEVAGNAVIGAIARIFTETAGPAMMFVFLAGAFAATFSTAFQLLRRLAAGGRRVLPEPVPGDGRAVRRRGRGGDRGPPALVVVGVQHLPRHDVLLAHRGGADHRGAAAAGLPGAGVVGAGVLHRAGHLLPQHLLLRDRHPKNEKGFYPSQPVVWFSWFSLAVFTALTFVIILARVFGVTLFGGRRRRTV